MADKVVKAASKCIFLAASRFFEMVRIADVGEIVSGGTPSTTQPELWDGDIVWVTPKDLGRPRNIEIDDSERKISIKGTRRILPKGTVLFSSRAPIGHVGIAEKELCTNQGFKNIVCSTKLYNRYLFHVLRANIEELDSLGHGNTFKEIPAKVLADFRIPLPPKSTQKEIGDLLDILYLRQTGVIQELPKLSEPLTEQRRIVARIEALAERIAAAQSLRREADKETYLFVNSLLSSILDKTHDRYKEVLLEDLIVDANYGTSVKCDTERVAGAIPVLRIPNVASEKVTLENMKFGELDEAEFQKTILQKGDILIVRTNGSADLVGRSAVVPDLPEPMSFASYMIRISCDTKAISPEFLQLVLRQQRTSGFLIDFARTTAGQYNVSLGRLRKTRIPLPSFEEQRQIVTYLVGLQAQVSVLRAVQAEMERELAALLPSVLDKAFKGEL